MPREPRSIAALRASADAPAFAAPYNPSNGVPITAEIDDVRMIEPPSAMRAGPCLRPQKAPSRLVSTTARAASESRRCSEAGGCATPALSTSTSIAPTCDRAVDERRGRRDQEADDPRDLDRLGQPLERDVAAQSLADLRARREDGRGHPGQRRPGADAVDADAARAELDRRRPGEVDDAALARRVEAHRRLA